MAYILSFVLLLASFTLSPIQTNAETLFKGVLVDASYEEVTLDDRSIEKQLKTITLVNNNGNTTTLNIDKNTKFFINSTSATSASFREGMFVEATVDFRKVKELQGFADIPQGGADAAIGEFFTGTVNEIDKYGSFISINLKDRQSQKYYLDENTQVFKDRKLVDLSELYEGDRVKLALSSHDSKTLATIEINVEGIEVEQVYKGVIQQIDTTQQKIVVKGEQFLQNWDWEYTNSTYPNSISNRLFTAKTPIYVGNKKIDPSQLRYYVNNEVYYVTINQLGKELIQKIVINVKDEYSYNDTLYSVDTADKKIRLTKAGSIPYHNGTIIIRNGRLIDPSALSQSGNAYVVTAGVSSNQSANIIYVTNNGFQSPSLSNHSVYFGQISSLNNYNLTLNNVNKLSNNYWYSNSLTNFKFSNSTVVTEHYSNSTITKTNQFTDTVGQYAYFYVKDNHIVAAHIVHSYYPAQYISVGKYDKTYSSDYRIALNNSSQWTSGSWTNITGLNYYYTAQAVILKNGKAISRAELNPNDRLFIIHDAYLNAEFILVN